MNSAARGAYVPDHRQHYQRVTHPARCNRRSCQARRNLSKHPALYARWPKCHVCGVGKMYVDWYRMKRGPKDKAPPCTDPNCHWQELHVRKSGVLVPFHRVDNEGCSGYEDYALWRAVVASKHSPRKPDSNQDDELPF